MRYLIIEKDRGLFLGTYREVSLFAKGNIFSIAKAPSFRSEDEAMSYIEHVLSHDKGGYGVIAINSNELYIGVIDIIKAGYGEYTHDLIDALPMISRSIH
jgi:hypothetical protein